MTIKPKVSIITVVYNGEEYLEETIRSVTNQTYDNIEYIIIDGGSTDQTINIIKQYEDKVHYWVSEKDGGIYDAMNKGIAIATGKWINFMNSGDVFHKNTVLESISFNDEKTLIYGKYKTISNDSYNKKVYGTKVLKKDFYFNMPICHQAMFIKLDAFKKIGLYNTDYKVSADHEWTLNLISFYGINTIYFQNIIVVNYLLDGFSVKNTLLSKKEKYKIANKFFQKKNNKYVYYYLLFKAYIFISLSNLKLIKVFRKVKSVFNNFN